MLLVLLSTLVHGLGARTCDAVRVHFGADLHQPAPNLPACALAAGQPPVDVNLRSHLC